MRGRIGYLSAALFAVVLAAGVQLSSASPQNNSGHPTPECVACATACEVAFENCKLVNGTSKSAFGQCARELEQCGAACRQPGGACHPSSQR